MASYKKFMMVFQISWKMSEVNTFIFNLDIFSANMEEEKNSSLLQFSATKHEIW